MIKFLKHLKTLNEQKRLIKENAETSKELVEPLARGEPLNLMNDLIFKIMLTSDTDDSREALRCLLSACTHREVSKVEILNNEILPPHLEGKSSRLDVYVTFNDGEIAALEMQMSRSDDDLKSILRVKQQAKQIVLIFCNFKTVHKLGGLSFT